MIGQALALGIVGGLGMRTVADRLGVPMTTAREWRRRFPGQRPGADHGVGRRWPCTWIRRRRARRRRSRDRRAGSARRRLAASPHSVRRSGRRGVALLESDQRRPGIGPQQKPARDARIRTRLDGGISLKEVHMDSDPREAIALFRFRSSAPPSTPGSVQPNAATWSVNWPIRPTSIQTAAAGPTRASRSIAGSAPIVSRASTACGHHHAPISASCAAIRSCWRKPASCARSCRPARRRRSPRCSSCGTASPSPNAPSASSCTRRGLHRAALAGQPRAFGRFEAERPNERWIGDVLVGPFVPHPRAPGSKRAYLFL